MGDERNFVFGLIKKLSAIKLVFVETNIAHREK